MIYFIIVVILIFSALLYLVLKSRNMEIWIFQYILQAFRRKTLTGDVKVYFCLADHYEPYFGNANEEHARSLVDEWMMNYRKIAKKHTDSAGVYPKHSYFYPAEEYDEYVINEIKKISDDGFGDLDIHLHHDNDTAENLKNSLNEFKHLLYDKHGLLRKDENGNIVYGFIHGNWALDNSRPDGKWCGVDNEIDVLIETGCVFDMTMPSAPSDTQTKIINSIYFAKEDGKPKSHNHGVLASVGTWLSNHLLMIQGPLGLNWKTRKYGILPKIEAGELSHDAPPVACRVPIWERSSVTIKGAENHIFIKLYTHGLQRRNMDMLFDGSGFDTLWSLLEKNYRDVDGYSLHYVTAWEMYSTIRSLINGEKS